jgi:hypothetical protein
MAPPVIMTPLVFFVHVGWFSNASMPSATLLQLLSVFLFLLYRTTINISFHNTNKNSPSRER